MVINPPLSRADLERIKRVVKLNTLPALTVVILVKYKFHMLPFAAIEHQPPRTLMIRVNQLRQFSPAGIVKELIRIAKTRQTLPQMNLVGVIEAPAGKVDCHVKIKFIAGRIVIVQIKCNRSPVDSFIELHPAMFVC
jgi:hypothetical protein